jgi:subtilase family serine protease
MRRNSVPRLLLTLIALIAIGVSAASAAVQNRITAEISARSTAPISGSVHPKVKLATDLGFAPGNQKLQSMSLRFSMSQAQTAALDQLLIDQQNPSSPRYHQWLTPAQYGAQFGLSSADIAKVTAWLTSQGFTVTGVANGGTFVTFDGTVAQAQTAFATSIHTLSLNGETHFANVTEASVPAAFAGVVMSITGLHDFRLKPRIQKANALHPQFTQASSGIHYMAPGDFYKIYNETSALTNSINGTGVTIAVMGQVDISLSDVAAFRSAAGLSATSVPTVIHEGTDPGGPLTCIEDECTPSDNDLAESSLDVEWSGAVAPGASILFVNGVDVFTNATTQAVDNNLAPIITVSYGNCEPAWGTTELNALNLLFKQANAQGQTIVGPTGDSGSTDCDDTTATNGLAVDFPASSPYVTAMGGTQFNDGDTTGTTTYWGSENTFTAGAAVPSATYSASMYIPEAIWNDAAFNAFGGGGGGPSAFFTKPYWQVGTGVPADASRDVPDLALNASDAHDPYLYCALNSCATGFSGTIANGAVAGGTSFATPTFAGILGLIEQQAASRLGNVNPTLYALGNNSTYYVAGGNFTSNPAVVFNDVTAGNNDSQCTGGTPYCQSGAAIGYNAGVGYDLASGWGSVNVSNLLAAWSKVTPIAVSGPAGTNVSTTTVSAPGTVAAGTAVTLTATVTSFLTSTTVPTGTVQFLVNNSAAGTPVTLNSSGVATYSLATSCANLGQQVIEASYSGDGTYASSKGAGITAAGFTTSANAIVTPIEVQVTSGSCPSFTLSQAQSITVTKGQPTATITLTPTNGFAGTVVFSASALETSFVGPAFSFSPSSVTVAAGSTTPVTTSLTLSNITAALRTPAAPGKLDPSRRAPWYAAGSGVTVASLLLLILPGRRRRLGGLLLVALSIALIGGASGCSSGNSAVSGTSSGNNADIGTYVVTVTGTFTSGSTVTTQNTTVTFTVQ